jgi:5-methylcytosine-specific restriction enzyme subunit McrC
MLHEWSRVTPAETALLRNLQLTSADRKLLDDVTRYTSLRVEELRQGLGIAIGPHIGTVALSCLRLVILPKLSLRTLLAMVAYAFSLAELLLTRIPSDYITTDHGLGDLLGLALLDEVKRITRGGLLLRYQDICQELTSPRGRIDWRHAAVRPKPAAVPCQFHELTPDNLLNQVLAAGLGLAARIVQSVELKGQLIRAAAAYGTYQQPLQLDSSALKTARTLLDRRSAHYDTALTLVELLHQSSHPGTYDCANGIRLAGFLFDMNRAFERFLTRYLQEHRRDNVEIISQDVRTNAFAYMENPGGWKQPTLRPDFVFLRDGKVIAIGDAKYQNHHEQPPSTTELYQLTTYGLAYSMPKPRQVFLFYPLTREVKERSARLRFAPDNLTESVQIRFIGVPIDNIVAGERWWPAPDVFG